MKYRYNISGADLKMPKSVLTKKLDSYLHKRDLNSEDVHMGYDPDGRHPTQKVIIKSTSKYPTHALLIKCNNFVCNVVVKHTIYSNKSNLLMGVSKKRTSKLIYPYRK